MRDGTAETAGALAATDARLADADRLLAETVSGAHRTAVESIRRLEAVQAEIEAAVAGRRTDSATAGQEFGRHLLDKTREITGIVAHAQSEAAAKVVVLQSLIAQYSRDSRE